MTFFKLEQPENTPFKVFERFGFQSGKTVNKFDGRTVVRSENGLAVIAENCNSYISLEVKDYLDLGTHGMFICAVTESAVLSAQPSVTYAYYHQHVKPKPKTESKGYACKICGYVYQGEELPQDFVCPICKHGAVDFEKI